MNGLEFGPYIRFLRQYMELSQREVAERCGIDFTYLSKIENGKVLPPSATVIGKLARVLEVDALRLVEMAEKPTIAQLRAENKELRAKLAAALAAAEVRP